jgi:homoserine kinase
VPATSANLGPGFDCLGVALDLWDDITAYFGSGNNPAQISVFGEEAPTDESNLVYKTILDEYQRLATLYGGGFEHELPELHIESLICMNNIPHARGLGSSSAAIVSATYIAYEAFKHYANKAAKNTAKGNQKKFDYTPSEIFSRCKEIEGHPDNVAPCVFGGVVYSPESAGWITDPFASGGRFEVSTDLVFTAFIPNEHLSTHEARLILPDRFDVNEANANTSNLENLVKLLSSVHRYSKPDAIEFNNHLLSATEDFLHQSLRSTLYPSSYSLMQNLRQSRVPAFISGAGPTVIAVYHKGDTAIRTALDKLSPQICNYNACVMKHFSPTNTGAVVS